MPRTEIVLYTEPGGPCPLLEWLDSLPTKAQHKCITRVERLGELGHELRRPECDTLRDGIHELRAACRGVQYRILYFFHEGKVVLAHGLVKEGLVPSVDIERAKRRRAAYVGSPGSHAHAQK